MTGCRRKVRDIEKCMFPYHAEREREREKKKKERESLHMGDKEHCFMVQKSNHAQSN